MIQFNPSSIQLFYSDILGTSFASIEKAEKTSLGDETGHHHHHPQAYAKARKRI